MFLTIENKCKYLEKKLEIYEKRFGIIHGVIHSIIVRDKRRWSVPIGELELAYMKVKEDNKDG